MVLLIIVNVLPNESRRIDGQACLDGDDSPWVMAAKEGSEPGMWSWSARV